MRAPKARLRVARASQTPSGSTLLPPPRTPVPRRQARNLPREARSDAKDSHASLGGCDGAPRGAWMGPEAGAGISPG